MANSFSNRALFQSSSFHRVWNRVSSSQPALRILVVGLLLATPVGAAEYVFEWENPVPQGNGLFAIAFEDDLIGYAVGSKGTSMKTTDGGQTWVDKTHFPDFTKNLRDVMVMGPGDLIAVGENPGIFRSPDGGQSWVVVPNPSTATRPSSSRIDPMRGFSRLPKTRSTPAIERIRAASSSQPT